MTPKMKSVELMKMRRKAEAANPRDVSANIAMDQRFFAVVTDGSIEKTLWIPNVSLSVHKYCCIVTVLSLVGCCCWEGSGFICVKARSPELSSSCIP